MQHIRLLMIDEHKMVRQGFKALLDRQNSFQVVGEVDQPDDALEMIAGVEADVVLVDVGVSHLNGMTTTRRIHERFPHVKVLAVAQRAQPTAVAGMLRAGASGYVLKHEPFESLVAAIHAVADGRTYLSPAVCNLDVQKHIDGDCLPHASTGPALTSREREVLQLISEGHATKEVAWALSLSVKTVETHRRQLMDKLDLHSVAELTKYAIREGITQLQ